MSSRHPNLYPYWLAALALFTLAAATGAFLRFGSLYGFGPLQFSHVRHAHSHLMYFGWVTPALMALITAWLPTFTTTTPSRLLPWSIGLTLSCALLSYPPFLLYGYQPATIAGRDLPLSVITAGLNVLAWYLFAWSYWRETRHLPRTAVNRPLQLWDTALLFILLATLGTIGLPIMTFTGWQSAFWNAALTHLFLDLFSEGWFVLALLGLIYAAHPTLPPHLHRYTDLLIMGLPVIFLLNMPIHLVPVGVRWVAAIGGLLVAIGLWGQIWGLWSAVSPGWKIPLAFLALKATAQLAILFPPVAQWAERNRLRVPYLHWLLLGFITLGLFQAAAHRWSRLPRLTRPWMTLAVLLLQASLIPLTGLWPSDWNGRWALLLAAWAALGPLLVSSITLLWGRSSTSAKKLNF